MSGASLAEIRVWLDAFVRLSRQVFPEAIPAAEGAAVGGDLGDVPVLTTAYAVASAGQDVAGVIAAAREDGGWLLVSEHTHHSRPGRNVYGWQFATAHQFQRRLDQHGFVDE